MRLTRPIVALLLFALSAGALWSREVPVYKGRVNDYAGRLSTDAEMILEYISFRHQQSYNDRVVLLTIDSLKGDPAEEFCIRALKHWELWGTEEQPVRSVLVLLASQEKLVRIQTSPGLAQDLHPNVSAALLSDTIFPLLQKGQFSVGLYVAMEAITDHLAAIHEKRKKLEKETGPAESSTNEEQKTDDGK